MNHGPATRRHAPISIVTIIGIGSVLLGLLYVWAVKPGVPYDELAHFEAVQYYLGRHAMPVLGRAGVSYEGQQGPVYYLAAALASGVSSWLPGFGAAYAVRVVGLLLQFPLVVAAHALARSTVPDRTAALVTATFVGLNPTLLAIGASVQNDTLSILLATIVLVLCLHAIERGRITVRDGAAIGLVCAVAILTKSSCTFLLASVPLGLLASLGRPAWRAGVAFAGTAVVLSGWWFARNLLLYGDLSATSAVSRLYSAFPPPLHLRNAGTVVHWIYAIAGYHWFPTEYLRNQFNVPMAFRVAVGALMLIALAGLLLKARQLPWGRSGIRAISPGWRFVLIQFGVCLAGYAVVSEQLTFTSPRVIFPTVAIAALLLASGGTAIGRRVTPRGDLAFAGILVFVLLAANAFVLHHAAGLPPSRFHM